MGVYKPIVKITEENNKIELYTDKLDENSFEELKEELEEILNFSSITTYHLQHEKKDLVILKHITN